MTAHTVPGAMRCRRLAARLAMLAATGASLPLAMAAQSGPDASPPDAGSGWQPVPSVGQPVRLERFVTVGYGVERFRQPLTAGISVSAGTSRAIGNPIVGLLGVGVEGYVGQRGARADGGVKTYIMSQPFMVHAGADWNARLRRVDPLIGVTVPLKRGGWPARGSQVRVEWLPTREHATSAGLLLPVGRPLAGRTRPKRVSVTLPPQSDAPVATPVVDDSTRRALREARRHMTQLASMVTFFWLIENRHLRQTASVREWRETLADFSAEFLSAPVSETRTHYTREAEAYHGALERAFAHAAGPATDDKAVDGVLLANAARRITLEEVVLPYNRTIGRIRSPNSLNGLAARALARYATWLRLQGPVDEVRVAHVLGVLDLWLGDMESLRVRIGRNVPDRRMHWLPMGLVLRPDEHLTQRQIDDLLELALGTPLESGNTVRTITGQEFQEELRRTIRETERYHVLWIHDYRGRVEQGRPDGTSLATTLTYLRALRDAAERYDSTGQFPAYVILLDQYFYEVNDGRFWMTLLERPLTHTVRLDTAYGKEARAIVSLQDSLRQAVSRSVRLQEQRSALGDSWVESIVKVHVNIINPSDFTFRSRGIVGLRIGADNLIRDHRKLILRDAHEERPDIGELILAGVGVGDHYASPTWDDRAMVVRGPGIAATRRHVWEALEQHGVPRSTLPAPLGPYAQSPQRDARIAELEASGATARFVQVHNGTGWAKKDATFVQMLLYDLAPEGTLIFVPDGLWTSYQWMAQLVGAALRGCHVYIVAPALPNAPSADFPQMSVTQELLTRLTLVNEVLGAAIRTGGGDLRIGFFAREAPLDDHAASLAAIQQTWAAESFLGALLPMTSRDRATLADARSRLDTAPPVRSQIHDVRARLPQLHRKTQWLISVDVLRELGVAAALPAIIGEAAGAHQRAGAGPPAHADSVSIAGVASDSLVRYFMTGSINKNVRSMALDAEVLGLVAGPWALESLADLVRLAGTVSWVHSIPELERHLPPYTQWRKLVGRRLHRIL